ncbi:MAG: hypothetical protein US23_C0012G0001, partial [candidate division WS6 bacterium GW2011_GWE1_36_69]
MENQKNARQNSPVAPDFSELRTQIDYLEEKLRDAEMAATAKLEESAPIKTLYKWRAPERIFNPKGREWYVSVGFVVMIIV